MYYRHVFVPIKFQLKEVYIDNKRHYLTPEGTTLPSVTTALKLLSEEGISKWKKRVGEKKANEIQQSALKIGEDMHQTIEDYLKNEVPKKRSDMSYDLFDQLKGELAKINNIRALEKQLYSNKLGVAGRVDCIANYNNKPSVIDFKSSKQKKKKEWIEGYFLQATAYSLMFEEITKKPHDQLVIMVSGKDGSVESHIDYTENHIKKLKDVLYDYNMRRKVET